jgi:thioredoxin-like negative regulator of GroEL
MNPDILVRSVLAAAFIASGLIIYWLVNKVSLARSNNLIGAISSYRRGKPTIIYFTTPTCAPCKTIQRPAIEMLKNRLGENLQVIEIDASKQPHLARDWGVISVPTTYVIDSDGKPHYVNHGVATAAKLIQQLEIEDFII